MLVAANDECRLVFWAACHGLKSELHHSSWPPLCGLECCPCHVGRWLRSVNWRSWHVLVQWNACRVCDCRCWDKALVSRLYSIQSCSVSRDWLRPGDDDIRTRTRLAMSSDDWTHTHTHTRLRRLNVVTSRYVTSSSPFMSNGTTRRSHVDDKWSNSS